MLKILLPFFIGSILLLSVNCTDNSTISVKPTAIDTSLKITFIELGSITCIPCQKMRPVMDSIQKKYGSQVLVKFIDVLKNYNEAKKYKINLMPTQVFLDTLNNEIHRHEGFYSEDSIHIFLQSKGLKIISE